MVGVCAGMPGRGWCGARKCVWRRWWGLQWDLRDTHPVEQGGLEEEAAAARTLSVHPTVV